jgi:hypothetical protein
MNKELELRVLKMCESLLPNTTKHNNKKMITLLADIRAALTSTEKDK